jgi:membrane-associated phospholipid phosphatase
MTRRFARCPLPFVLLLLFASLAAADLAQNVSDSVGFVIAAYTVNAAQGDREDREEARQITDSLFVTAAVTQGLKELVNARRPDLSDYDSFPSMHSSLAAAWAAVAAEHHPKQRLYYAAYVSAVGWSRVDLDRHKRRDVIAGALLGAAIGKHYSARHGGYVLGRITW